MITRNELNPHGYELVGEVAKANFERLYNVMNSIRLAYNRPMYVSGPIRSKEDQQRIYADLNARRKATGMRTVPVPMNSAHMVHIAAAVDIFDRDKTLWNWCMANVEMLRGMGVHLEDGTQTHGWVHFQVVPPRSGNFVFSPYSEAERA